MSLAHYPLTASIDRLNFEFYSDGPRGRIKKIINYTKLEQYGVYNLGFGDLNERTGEIDDFVVSDNQDRDKVMGTVAQSILDFLTKHPAEQVVFTGSTPIRTRLYSMEISKRWNDVDKHVLVKGLTSEGWEPFQQNRGYKAILVRQKNPTFKEE